MNKTVNINLGGMFFHIDEDAYQKMTRYFDAIKRSLSNSTGQDEIIKDIEMRIAELISEKHTSDKQVINIKELDEIIAVMGQPEDYRIEDDSTPSPAYADFQYTKRTRKLYRDIDNGMLGGVCSGLGLYFGIDRVWVRIILLLLIWAGGTGIVAYIVLWIIVPPAVTTTEKLEMTGEPVTISNIEKKVREEFDNVSDRIKNANYDEMGRQVKTGAGRVAANFSEVFGTFFNIVGKILGAFITVFAAITLGGLLVALFILATSSFSDAPWQQAVALNNHTSLPIALLAILGFFAIAIPFFFLFILGLKLLVKNLRSIGSVAKYTLLAIWILSVAALSAVGFQQATAMASTGKSIAKEELAITTADTLTVQFKHNAAYSENDDDFSLFTITQDEKGQDIIYSNDVSLTILETDQSQPYMQIEKKANGKSASQARARAQKINYNYTFANGQLVLDNYLTTEATQKAHGQEVQINLYLPKGMVFKADKNISRHDHSDDGYFNLHYSGTYAYKVGSTKIMCLNCPADENDWDDIENDSIPEIPRIPRVHESEGVHIDRDGIRIIEKDASDKSDKTRLEINKDGIIVKTK